MSEPKVETMWAVYDGVGCCFWSLDVTRRDAIYKYTRNSNWTQRDWGLARRRGDVRCVRVDIVPEALMQELLAVLQSCERALVTTWGSEDDLDLATCREITFDVSKLLMKCNKPSVLDPKTLGPVQ